MASSAQHEPTMEEILASIRKIISEDAPEPASEIVPAAPHADADSEVLELTQVVEEPAHEPVPEPVVSAPEPAPEPEPAPMPEPVVQAQPVEEHVAEAAPAPIHEGIFSDHTRKAMEDTFSSIPEHDEPQTRAAAPVAPVDGASIEAVFERAVRESFDPVLHDYLSGNAEAIIERMKPLIREWMDEHFPALLEGAVRAEVERVVKARGAKR